MAGSARLLAAALAAITLATARAHIPSHDNILRIQLWDAEGLSRDPVGTQAPSIHPKRKVDVNLESLNDAMLEEWYGSDKFTKHRVRHKRRRTRHSDDFTWKFHSSQGMVNVHEYDPAVSWDVIESNLVNASAVSDSGLPGKREVSPPMTLSSSEEDEVKQLPVVPKCCASGQNLSLSVVNGVPKFVCSRTSLTFQPVFFTSNETHMWSYDSNVYETIVGNPCPYDRYKLEPDIYAVDEFYLLINGSLFLPYKDPYLLGTKDFCMETFYNETNPAGLTLPLVCFTTPAEETKFSATMFLIEAICFIVSIPFLLLTATYYLYCTTMKDTHGNVLSSLSISLAVAFLCIAIMKMVPDTFPQVGCTILAYFSQILLLSCYACLCVMWFDVFLNVRQYGSKPLSKRSQRWRCLWYISFTVVLPVLIVLTTYVMQLPPTLPATYFKPDFEDKGCFIKRDTAALPFFYGPVVAVYVFIIIASILISRHVRRPFSTSSSDWTNLYAFVNSNSASNANEQEVSYTTESRPNIKRYRRLARQNRLLSLIMFIPLLLDVVYWMATRSGAGGTVAWSVLDFIVATQGIFIFVIFVVTARMREESQFLHVICCRRTTVISEARVVNV